ncbi:NADH-ubiquinone oxidoreductase subunit GRIM-19 [Sporothrix schenckii 1099-18]|uniref:NADH dehydrogenase [ubiquinone] 1 alpha subcomplex subunit 13 n=1 Tax=Sporothrix schenckii 1099-18 TaxID=1397361 RepID=A0A0F2MCX2_SPOSC|nr:NADH-ubiquinone oxidoreductase subunit GRIM-19 [Sporothrix schenckii 1099-18]KJR87533.1 NADH-ubiquinone oxidoreductase subunit GRIM-19 [Sporothrix schenckii 1099-18]
MPQDMPPTGGYAPVQYKGRLQAVVTARGGSDRGMLRRGSFAEQRGRNLQHGRQKNAANHRSSLPIQRNLPSRGFRPAILLGIMGAAMGYGWFKLAVGVREQHEMAREKMWSRIHLIPLLQAEEDRDQVRRHLADQARERELLGDNTKVYNSDRFVRPTFAATPRSTTK